LDIKKSQKPKVKSKKLKGKRILITAGPTWVPIDSVRVISNIASGATGILVAKKLECLGAQVTLLLGPAGNCCIKSGIKVLNFRFFDELKGLMFKELKSKRYDILIHSAAVSDYRPARRVSGKVNSGLKKWRMDLVPTEKIINRIRALDKNIFLVGFKFEPRAGKRRLILQARKLMQNTGADLVVANTCFGPGSNYGAFILSRENSPKSYYSKKTLAEGLIHMLGEGLCKN
jgi:phosphopantothenoylcysteine decarboxylase/phosphopantothenate--cysteine ligase